MTREEHIARHKKLHQALDELLADYMRHTVIVGQPATMGVLNRPIGELMRWSFEQTKDPTEPADGEFPKRVTNTAARGILGNAAAVLVPGGIETQEALGQLELVASEVLPAEGSEDPAWAAMGVVFGPPVEGDPLFRQATLPAGWKKVPTEHSMWSRLVDGGGVVRGRIFYKAAFYDRRATIYPGDGSRATDAG